MSTYIVGDIQGCFKTFTNMLKEINFKHQTDQAILLGDVINRGPSSLDMLRYIYDHQASISMVLGNHEIFALALYLDALKPKSPHTLDELLAAKDASELFTWLRQQRLMLKIDNNIFVHAGILPAVSAELAQKHNELIHHELNGPQAGDFLKEYFARRIFELREGLDDRQSAMLALAYFTLMRTCTAKTTMDLSFSGPLADVPAGQVPWFVVRDDGDQAIFFGHWAALGLYHFKNYFCLDSGCGWGRSLSALRLDDHQVFQVANCEIRAS